MKGDREAKDRVLGELFRGVGAQPRPEPEEIAGLGRLLARFTALEGPRASGRVARGVAAHLAAQRRTAELFQGEEALADPGPEARRELAETMTRLSGLPSPPASPRVAQGVRRHLSNLAHRRRIYSRDHRFRLFCRDFREACRESRLIKALAACLLLQALAIPVTGAITYYRRTVRPGGGVTPVLPEPTEREPREHLLLAEPEIPAPRANQGRQVPFRPEEQPELLAWLRLENRLRLRAYNFSLRREESVRLERLRGLGAPRTVDLLVQSWCRALADRDPATLTTHDLALSLRALVLAGNTRESGPQAAWVARQVPRLEQAWDDADTRSRIQIGVTLAELFNLSGGRGREMAARAVRWCARWAAEPANLAAASNWSLGDAAEMLQWAPLLTILDYRPQRLLIRAELEQRLELVGPEGTMAAAVILRTFPESAARARALARTEGLRRRPAGAAGNPRLLVSLAWGLSYSPRHLVDFIVPLRAAAISLEPAGPAEIALWTMVFSIYYSAPGERPR